MANKKILSGMIWTYILGIIIAMLCGNTIVERLLYFFGLSINVGVWSIVDMMKTNNNERKDD